jgi:hypothetical protein
MKRLFLVAALVLAPLPAAAQNPITGYFAQYYNAGAPQPLTQTETIPASAVQCGVTPKLAGSGASTINPNTILWDDPANPATADCRVNLGATSVLVSLPIGAYEGVVVPVSAGGNGLPSNRAPFSLAPLPSARTGIRFIRS